MKTIIITFVSLSIAFGSSVQPESSNDNLEVQTIMSYDQQGDMDYIKKLQTEKRDDSMIDLDAI